MAQWYYIEQANPAGDPYTSQYGEFQTYFLKVQGQERSFMVNKKVGNPPRLGWAWGDASEFQKKDGTIAKVLKFKQLKDSEATTPKPAGPGSVGPGVSSPVQSNISETVPQWATLMNDQIKDLTARVESLEKTKGAEALAEAMTEPNLDLSSEPINLDDIPF